MEIWKDIEGYEGLYQISDEGRVKSLKRNTLLNPSSSRGYLLVNLYKDGKATCKQVHRLVAEAFIPNPQNLPEVNHKDEDKSSNIVENLEWCDRSYNVAYGTGVQRSSKKRSKCVDQIDAVTGEVIRKWASVNECGRNGFTFSGVAACARGEVKTFKGYVWKYLQA